MDAHARALNRKLYSVYRIRLDQKTGRFERPDPERPAIPPR
jgi:hypothetical protein